MPLGGEPTVKTTLAGLPEPITMVPPADGARETGRHTAVVRDSCGQGVLLTRPIVPLVAHPEPTCRVYVCYENYALAADALKETKRDTCN